MQCQLAEFILQPFFPPTINTLMSNAEFSCKTATITITKEQEKKNIFIATESIKFPIYCKHP